MKPILYNITPFDSAKENEIQFIWNGNQVFKHTCNIYENTTEKNLIYTSTEDSMQLKHTIPKNILANGKSYCVNIIVYDKNNVASEVSDSVFFYCFSTPTFELDNILKDDNGKNVIRNSSYQLVFNYHQAENEPLQEYEVQLYDVDMHLLQTSGKRYDTNNLAYTLTDLEDNKNYNLKIIGLTIHGMEVETASCYFSVNYIQPAIYSILALENIKEHGYIKIQSNIRAVSCKTDKETTYINGEYIDLRDNKLTIDEDFSFDNDFIISVCGFQLVYGQIMSLHDEANNLYLYLRKGSYESNNRVEKLYIELNIPIGLTKHICMSNFIDIPLENEMVHFNIIKKDGLYSIQLEKVVM